jgi:flagellar biosynthesis anti-sigma factor FlgM
MRIDLNSTPVTQGTEQSAQTAQQRALGKDPLGKEGVSGSDQAEVSPLAQSLAAADPGRIEQLRLQVESGSYDVSAQTVANALIDAHLKE